MHAMKNPRSRRNNATDKTSIPEKPIKTAHVEDKSLEERTSASLQVLDGDGLQLVAGGEAEYLGVEV